jgi:hypothetical protein
VRCCTPVLDAAREVLAVDGVASDRERLREGHKRSRCDLLAPWAPFACVGWEPPCLRADCFVPLRGPHCPVDGPDRAWRSKLGAKETFTPLRASGAERHHAHPGGPYSPNMVMQRRLSGESAVPIRAA